MTKKREHGDRAEALVCHHLKQQGFSILAQNYLKRYGEIDIVAAKKGLVAFVEVKMRHNPQFDLSYLINTSKQRKIALTAKAFIMEYNVRDAVCRFDVALVTNIQDSWNIQYIENAFYNPEE